MRVVLVAGHVPPRFLGGVERVVVAQARALAARGHDVRVVAGTDDPHRGTDVERARLDGIDVAVVPRRDDERASVDPVRPRVAALVEREARGADAVLVHHWATLSGDVVRRLAPRAPVALWLHDHFASCVRTFRRPPARGVVCPTEPDPGACAACLATDVGVARARLADLVRARAEELQAELEAASLVVSPSVAHLVRLADHVALDGRRVHVLPPGHALALPPGRRRPRPWTGDGPLGVLHFGRRSVEKGTLDLVRALAPLPAGTARLVCAGGPVDAAFDAELRAEAGALDLELLGPFDDAGLAALAADCHLAALPSRLPESYSLALDEALALGLPTWITFEAVARERYARTSFDALPAGDPGAWTDAFEALLAHPDHSAAAFAALPGRVPTADDAAAELEELLGGLVAAPRAA